MGQPQADNAQQLQDAFLAFSQMSVQLEASYRELENRVAGLNEELAAARGERLRQLAEKERLADRLGSLLSALPGGVIVLDGDDRVVECNPVAIDLLKEPLINEQWHDVTRRAFAPQSGDTHEISLQDGRRITISVRDLDSGAGRILLLNDVTETRRLQDRVNRQERLSAMGEMTASLAHQIRTPLSAALLYASHLAGLESPAATRFSAKLLNCLRHLERTANDMLVFARGGRLDDSVITVSDLLAQLAENVEPQIRTRNAEWKFDDRTAGATIQGNRETLLGALVNLVSNGLQACDEAPVIQLDARVLEDGAVLVRCCDNGCGMTEEVRARIFEPFFTTRSNGTGLGLAVVQSIVRVHHGEIDVSSVPGEGTCFEITLPPASAAQALSSGKESANEHSLSILKSTSIQ